MYKCIIVAVEWLVVDEKRLLNRCEKLPKSRAKIDSKEKKNSAKVEKINFLYVSWNVLVVIL